MPYRFHACHAVRLFRQNSQSAFIGGSKFGLSLSPTGLFSVQVLIILCV